MISWLDGAPSHVPIVCTGRHELRALHPGIPQSISAMERAAATMPGAANSSGLCRCLCIKVAAVRVVQDNNRKLTQFHLVNGLAQ